jgi:hypothetical protein
MFTAGIQPAGKMESSRDSSLVANGPPAPGRLHFPEGAAAVVVR